MTYIIEEPEGTREYIVDNDEYWLLYSSHQKKRLRKVISQFNLIWYNVYKTLSTINDYDMNASNELMNKVHKLFFIEYKSLIGYYNDELIKNRKKQNYIKKKINKLKTAKNKI